jgi:peptidoglycan/LPS O-acetylase OafA/YrhL
MGVVIYHLGFWGVFGAEGILNHLLHSSYIGDLLAPFSFFGWVGVEIVFVISGFVVAYSAEGATAFSFFRSRFVRLMPGVWICSTLAIPAAFFVDRLNGATIAKLYVKSMVLFPHGQWIVGVIWTLPVEISFYTAVFATIYFNQFKRIGLVASVIGLYSCAFL